MGHLLTVFSFHSLTKKLSSVLPRSVLLVSIAHAPSLGPFILLITVS